MIATAKDEYFNKYLLCIPFFFPLVVQLELVTPVLSSVNT